MLLVDPIRVPEIQWKISRKLGCFFLFGAGFGWLGKPFKKHRVGKFVETHIYCILLKLDVVSPNGSHNLQRLIWNMVSMVSWLRRSNYSLIFYRESSFGIDMRTMTHPERAHKIKAQTSCFFTVKIDSLQTHCGNLSWTCPPGNVFGNL